jgi:cyanophycin synthetase
MGMAIRQVRFLAGPNVWSRGPVLEARVAIADWTALTAEQVSALEARLAHWLPGYCIANRSAPEPVRITEVLARLAAALQSCVGATEAWSSLPAPTSADTLAVAFASEEERLARACLASAERMRAAGLAAEAFDAPSEIARLRALAEDVCLGRATGPLVAAARARGIPARRLDDESLVQLGHGARRRRIRTSMTERTGKIAEWISLDKELCKRLLAEIGIPVPIGRRVASAEEAWAAACELGLPVAVKPVSADYGHGVGLHLGTRAQVVAAFTAAREYRDEVLVERFVPGAQYRLTVVGDRMVAAVRREPVRVCGDGQHTIAELMEIANQDPRRGDDLRLPLTKVCPDDDTEQVLAEQGYALGAVLPIGREVVMSRIAHSWAGAGVTDVTDRVHPRVAWQCARAARLLGLDVAGLDVLAEDIGRPLEEQGGAILEVNAEPTIAFHFPPLCDCYRPVCEAIIDSLFPRGEDGRIPVALLTGPGDLARLGRVLAGLLRAPGRGIARAAADGLFLDEKLAKSGRQSNLAGSLVALLCPEVDLAVLERDLASIRDEGLGIDRVDVTLVTRLGPAVSPEDARVARVAVAAAAPRGALVIDGGDQASRALADAFPGATIWVGQECESMVDTRPERAALFLRSSELVLRLRDRQEQTVSLPGPALGSLRANQDWLLALAAAWAMGTPSEALGARLPVLLEEEGA